MIKSKSAKEPTYGEAAGRLEEILKKIEEGAVDIDELSGLVKEAAELVTLCRAKIRAAEVQVKTITEQLEREVAAETGGDDEDDGDGKRDGDGKDERDGDDGNKAGRSSGRRS